MKEMVFMSWLKTIRIKEGYVQKDVSNAAGISQPSYCNIENGERKPSVDTAKKIAAFLGFDWTMFYEDGEEVG